MRTGRQTETTDIQRTQCISSSEEHFWKRAHVHSKVTVPSSGESVFNGVLRGAACALEVRTLLLEMNIKMEVEI